MATQAWRAMPTILTDDVLQLDSDSAEEPRQNHIVHMTQGGHKQAVVSEHMVVKGIALKGEEHLVTPAGEVGGHRSRTTKTSDQLF